MTSIGSNCYGGTVNCNEINVKEKINGYKISELVERMKTLEKTNKTLTENLEKVNERVNESKVLEETLNKKIEDLEASVSFLKNKNTILETLNKKIEDLEVSVSFLENIIKLHDKQKDRSLKIKEMILRVFGETKSKSYSTKVKKKSLLKQIKGRIIP